MMNSFFSFWMMFVPHGGKSGRRGSHTIRMQVRFRGVNFLEEACEKERKEDERLAKCYISLPPREPNRILHGSFVVCGYKGMMITFGKPKELSPKQSKRIPIV